MNLLHRLKLPLRRCRRGALAATMLAPGFVHPVTSDAASLGDIATALAAPATSAQATNDWASLAKLKQVRWKGKAPAKGGNQYYWNGSLSLDGLGAGEISLVGTQKVVTSATATVQRKIELAKITQVVAAQFPKDAKLEQVRGACPGEAMSGSDLSRHAGGTQATVPARAVGHRGSRRFVLDVRTRAAAQLALDLLKRRNAVMANDSPEEP
jgi:hypothetical protein